MKTSSPSSLSRLPTAVPPKYDTVYPPQDVSMIEQLDPVLFVGAELKHFFECPVCYEYITPPIYQCIRGHLVCKDCLPRLSSCPTCRDTFHVCARNLMMEKMSNCINFPCKYAHNGCTEQHTGSTKSIHESICSHRDYYCPCPGVSCGWIGSIDKVFNHLRSEHNHIILLEGDEVIFLVTNIDSAGNTTWAMLQKAYGHEFLIFLLKETMAVKNDSQTLSYFKLIVKIIGMDTDAYSFKYRIEISGNHGRLLYESKPQSLQHRGFPSSIENDCLIFDECTAERFSKNGTIPISIRISCPLEIRN